MEIAPYLKLMAQRNGSDLFFSTNARPQLKTEGKMLAIGDKELTSADVSALAYILRHDSLV